MQTLPIESVEVDSTGSLFVRLQTDRSYELIYRDASGLRWNREQRAFHAFEPARWEPVELLQHMATTLRECCDEELIFTNATTWAGVPPSLRDALKSALTVG